MIRSWREKKINHWCNVSGESVAHAANEANARSSIYCLVTWSSYCIFLTMLQLTHFSSLARKRDSQTQQWGWGSVIYACELWIYQASEGQYMFYTTLPSIYFGWGYDLIAGGSIDDGLPDLSAQVRQDHQLRRRDRHAECTVTCCLWLVVLSQVSFSQNRAVLQSFCSLLWLLPDMRQ